MIWIIVIGVIGLLCGLVDDDPLFEGMIGAFAGAVIGFLVASAIGAIIYGDTHLVPDKPIPLESLVDGSAVQGSFFLGSGVIDEVSVFTWYERTAENSFKQERANADESTVHFLPSGSTQKPYYVQMVKRHERGPFLSFWGVHFNEEDWVDSYDFYVPKGTIKPLYELDAK